jgi:hypothetical protein
MLTGVGGFPDGRGTELARGAAEEITVDEGLIAETGATGEGTKVRKSARIEADGNGFGFHMYKGNTGYALVSIQVHLFSRCFRVCKIVDRLLWGKKMEDVVCMGVCTGLLFAWVYTW